jgi:hypothetical protein
MAYIGNPPAPQNITSSEITDGTIVNVDIASDAAIAATKIAGLSTVATSGAYSDVTGTPTLATVATSGAYSDVTGTPTLGTAAGSATGDFATAAQGTKADAALPKAGGAMTGPITTNSTFDGVDIAVRDAVLTSTTTKADAALPKAGGTMSGDIDGNGNKVLFANVYPTTGDLPSASTYHGMFAHVHATGKGYFAHSGSWVELANSTDLSTVATSGSYADLSNKPTIPVVGTNALAYDANLQGFVTALTLPTSDGSSGQFLTTNGSGTLSFADAGGGGGLKSIQVFTQNNTWTKPSGISLIRVRLVGAGGGGAGGESGQGGAGGAAGGYSEKLIDVSSVSSVSVTVPTGAAAGQNGGGAQTGSTTSFGTYLSATGGNGGSGGTSGLRNSSRGGLGVGGDINSYGGGNSAWTNDNRYTGGKGGASYFGDGVGNEQDSPPPNGLAYGAGGTGGGGYSGDTVGCKGGDGIIIVEEYE